ncbi:hypothetical protein BCR44DRAFT_1511758 [Catenaria anguillulae PL171]|uniref:FAD/NAD(P)-binding domain-containing protein n=1 Tax=Catenaria anguillulae PL171 TaxID=765915 RepID=A0A1Y2HSV9_9FUNG|nr:hypothetical protein BCR44DRAFT_1511758 [Catenaria anguillulae PL171]
MNLVAQGHKVSVFSRAPLKYAVYMPEDWILYDNTGLKGQAAAWAKANLEDAAAREKLGIRWVDLPADGVGEDKVYAAHWDDIKHIVYAIGFRTRGMPDMVVDGKKLAKGDLSYDPATGQLVVKSQGNKKVPNARGFGIAFPERITDRMGNVEWSVGMWKFMRYVTEVIQEGELTLQ